MANVQHLIKRVGPTVTTTTWVWCFRPYTHSITGQDEYGAPRHLAYYLPWWWL